MFAMLWHVPGFLVAVTALCTSSRHDASSGRRHALSVRRGSRCPGRVLPPESCPPRATVANPPHGWPIGASRNDWGAPEDLGAVGLGGVDAEAAPRPDADGPSSPAGGGLGPQNNATPVAAPASSESVAALQKQLERIREEIAAQETKFEAATKPISMQSSAAEVAALRRVEALLRAEVATLRAREDRLLPVTEPNKQRVPRDALEDHFERVMQSNAVPLFKDFDAYLASMPVRGYGYKGSLFFERLCDLPYWARVEDIEIMAKQLESRGTRGSSLKYACAPSGSGKTTSVLPAFLTSAKKGKEDSFTHYLYLAFANNNRRNFRRLGKPADDDEIANDQGAAFIFACVRHLLTSEEYPCYLDVVANPRVMEDTLDEMITFFDEMIPNGRILVHVDEHRRMCDEKDRPRQSAAFRRGALETLSRVPRVTVEATYTNLPYEISAEKSSQVCRDPNVVPQLDVDQLMQVVDELSFPADPSTFNDEQRRLWVTMRIRLAAMLTSDFMSVHKRAKDWILEFLRDFQTAAQAAKDPKRVTQALKDCVLLCKPYFPRKMTANANALKMLLGVLDDEIDKIAFERQVDDLLVANDGFSIQLTVALRTLLRYNDPNYPVYTDGRDLLRSTLESKDELDYLSASPLEAAYAWVLSCQSAFDSYLKFTYSSRRFDIECKKLLPGRLFPGVDTAKYDASKLEDDVVYYADERNGKPTHPLCDIFFRTAMNEVVLIDVTGGGRRLAGQKKTALENFIAGAQGGVQFHGVVLAPFAEYKSTTSGSVTVVGGNDANELLGGLVQITRWFPRDGGGP